MAFDTSKLSKDDKLALEEWNRKCESIATATVVKEKESKAEKEKRIAKAKKTYTFFVEYYFPHYASSKCAKFQIEAANKILADKNIFAILEWAREHAKSVHADVLIPLWLWINDELDGMVLVNKNEKGAKRLLGDVQAEVQFNDLLIHDYGKQYNVGHWMEGDFMFKDGTFFVALGAGQSPRGLRKGAKRPNYASIDDIDEERLCKNQVLIKETVDWILGAVFGALNNKAGRVVVANNRIHKKSILAHLVGDIEPGVPKREGIWHSKVCAIENGVPAWKENYTLEILNAKIKKMGWRIAQREYFHNPITEGGVFKEEWIHWKKVNKMDEYDGHVIYFDPSFKSSTKNDFKAIRHWGKMPKEFHCIKSFVRQCTISEAVCWLYDYYESIYPNLKGCDYNVPSTTIELWMEANFIQDLFLDEFMEEGARRGWQLPIRPDHRKKDDKTTRIESLTPFYEREMIFFNEAEKGNRDMQTGLEQILAFDHGSRSHDDAPDADEGAIWQLQKFTRAKQVPPRLGTRKPRGW